MGRSRRMSNSQLNQLIEKKLDSLFSKYPSTQETFEMKEELFVNIREHAKDHIKTGADMETAIELAFDALGNIDDMMNELNGAMQVKQKLSGKRRHLFSTIGILLGLAFTLFGLFISSTVGFMQNGQLHDNKLAAVTGSTIFIVIGVSVLVFSVLIRETDKKYGMNVYRALFYTLSFALILFGVFVGFSSWGATNEVFIGISSSMVFMCTGIVLLVGMQLTGYSRLK